MKKLIVLVLAFLTFVNIIPAQTKNQTGKTPIIDLPLGYQITKVASGLTYATSLTFDNQGNMYVLEAGGQFLEEPPPPRIMRVNPNGTLTEIANLATVSNNQVQDSVVGLVWFNGDFYFTHRTPNRDGAVSRWRPGGMVQLLFSGFIDSQAEHQLNDIKVGPDNRIYFTSGPATNSGVVGIDLAPFVSRSPGLRSTPCQNIILTGVNFETPDFRTPDPSDLTRTGAFVPFGTATTPGQQIPGSNRCGSAIFSFDPANPSGALQVYAWGFRNIIGLAWNRNQGQPGFGNLYAAVNGYDTRGSRPIIDEADATYRVQQNTWYGYPDFSAALEPFTALRPDDPTQQRFDSPDSLQAPQFIGNRMVGKNLRFVIDHVASGLTPPDRNLVTGLHEWNSSPSLLDVAPTSWGPLAGQIFVAEWGDLAPPTTPFRDKPTGSQVVRIDPATRQVIPFVRNRRRGPASAQGALGLGLERPFDVRFGPDGAMYIVDYGVVRINMARAAENQYPADFPPQTGAIWRVTRTSNTAAPAK